MASIFDGLDTRGRGGGTGGEGIPGAGGPGGPATPKSEPEPDTGPGSEADLIAQAERVEDEENRRYRSGLDVLNPAFENAQNVLSQGVDTNLLFSQAADAVGSRSRGSLRALRRSMGARNINPNSGAAQGLMSRMIAQNQGALIGASRDIAISDRDARQRNAAVNFGNALNLAGFRNAPVSSARLQTSQNIFEGNIAREGIAAMAASQGRASKDNKKASTTSSVLGILPF